MPNYLGSLAMMTGMGLDPGGLDPRGFDPRDLHPGDLQACRLRLGGLVLIGVIAG